MTAASSRPWRRALLWLACLGPFFFASYGLANWMAGRRAHVPAVVFDWERGIPFWAWTIVPYWSIDVLYALSFFLCRDRRELDTHGRRLLTAQVLAVGCFLLWPLRFSFERPPTDGISGWLFDVLLGFDKPFNQAPSLHIVLLIVLWVLYATHVSGVMRWLLHGWFALIGLSVLTTFQHHFVDVPTGLAVGWLCVWLWPQGIASPLRGVAWARDPKRWRLAIGYAVGALLLALAAFAWRGWAWWLCWPALSLLLVAADYVLFGATGFQKRQDGRLSLAALWLYAPYSVAAWLNSRLWTRRRPRPVPVADGVWLGRMPGPGQRHDFAVVVDVCAELSLADARPVDVILPMLDLVVPAAADLREVATDIEQARAHGDVLVCCALGYSRSAAAVAAWLIGSGRADSAAAAIAQVRTAKPQIVLGPRHVQTLTDAFADTGAVAMAKDDT